MSSRSSALDARPSGETSGAARPARAPRSAPWLRRTSAALLAALTLSGAAPALGQSKQDLDKARTMFREGVALSAAQDWSGALAKFKQVAQVKMTAQVAFNIAECEEHLGKLLAALGNYRLAQSEAAAPNANAPDVAKQVDARITSLEGRIPKLTIKRGEGADSATIELDGVELGAAQIGTPISIDPGPHAVVGKINGKEGSRETVTVAEKENKEVSIVIDVAAMPKQAPTAAPTTTDEAPPPPPPGRSKLPAAIALGVGGASLVAGVVFLILRQGTISDLEDQCAGGAGGDDACPPGAESTADDGKLYTGLAEVTLAAGVVGVTVGIVLLATSGGSSSPPSSAKLTRTGAGNRRVGFVGAAPGADVGGASLVGRF